jgi:hypothetical protein
MKWMRTGFLAFLCSMLGETVHAQQNCACSAASAGAGQPVFYDGISTQPVVAGSLAATPVVDAGAVTGQPLRSGRIARPAGAQGGRMADYSYWVANPGPARTYVSYGALDQFPFQGRPYGNPGDRWSWYYMGGGNSRYLTRYYYPLLP